MPTYRELVELQLRDFEGYTGDGFGNVGDLPVGDRSTARKPISKRDLREVLLAGETAVQTAVDAAAAASLDAATAEQAMLDVQGATLYASSLATLLANTGAYPVGTVFATRREGYSYEVVASDPDRTTAGGMMLRALPTSSGTLRPEQFGAVGDGVANDTAAFRRMLSRFTRRYEPDPEKRYHITGQLDLGRNSEWVTPIRLHVTGSRTASDASLNVQTGGGSQHLTLLFAQGQHKGAGIDISVETAETAPWLAIIGNDYYLHPDGSRPAYPTEFDFGKVRISATSYSAGYSGDGNAAIRFQGMDSVEIDRLFVRNFQQCYRHYDVTEAEIGTRIVNLDNFRSGVQVTRSRFCAVGKVFARGSTEMREYVPGANALVVRSVEEFIAGDVICHDAGEHGIRITSGFAEGGAVSGLRARDIFTRASFGNIRIYRPGGCGFKVASGDSDDTGQPPIDLVRIDSLYVEDAGLQDYDTNGTFTGQNHFGLNLQRVNSFACGSYVTRRVNALHNGRHFALIRTTQNFYIGSFQGNGCYGDAVFWNSPEIAYNIEIGTGVCSDYGRGGEGRMLHFFNPANMGRVSINLNAHNGPTLMRFAGTQTGTPLSFWNIRSTYFNVADPVVAGASEIRSRIEVRPATTAITSGEALYGVEDMLLCRGEAGPNSTVRNGLCDVYLDASQTRSYVAVNAGQAPSSAVGAQLPGVWRARGQSGDAFLVFVQKVAM